MTKFVAILESFRSSSDRTNADAQHVNRTCPMCQRDPKSLGVPRLFKASGILTQSEARFTIPTFHSCGQGLQGRALLVNTRPGHQQRDHARHWQHSCRSVHLCHCVARHSPLSVSKMARARNPFEEDDDDLAKASMTTNKRDYSALAGPDDLSEDEQFPDHIGTNATDEPVVPSIEDTDRNYVTPNKREAGEATGSSGVSTLCLVPRLYH